MQGDAAVEGPQCRHSLRDPGRVFEDRGESGHELGSGHLVERLQVDHGWVVDGAGPRAGAWMRGDPVPGDVDAPADPHALVSADIVEKPLQRGDAARPAAQPGMQADGQHLRRVESRRIAFAIQRVEGVLQVVEELRAGIKALRCGEAHVVAVEGIGNDEVRRRARARRPNPVRQVVGVGIRIVKKAAVLDHEAPRIGAVAARIPTQGGGAGQRFQDRDRFGQVFAFDGLVHRLVANPAQAVRCDLVAEFAVRRHGLGVALERPGDAEHGERQAAPLEGAQYAPESGARAVLEQRFHAHVAHRECRRADDLRQEGLGAGIAVEYAILGAFLVIQHELHRDPSAVRPARMRGLRAIAAEVAGIGHAEGLRGDSGWTRGGSP